MLTSAPTGCATGHVIGFRVACQAMTGSLRFPSRGASSMIASQSPAEGSGGMRLVHWTLAAAALAALSACTDPYGNPRFSETERAVLGAGAGAAIADATDNSVATGAVLGGLVGAASDDRRIYGR